ncbi:MAG: RNA-binding protein [Verrucomicrobia bacterium]|nr:RNA-binding protein [Verrucomicrobiota bacterium]
MKLYVGNLSFHTTADDLQTAFEPFGAVAEVALISDRVTGRSRGFAFVTMGSRAEGQAAIEGLQGHELDGRALSVNEARPREERERFGGDRPSRPSGAKQRRW